MVLNIPCLCNVILGWEMKLIKCNSWLIKRSTCRVGETTPYIKGQCTSKQSKYICTSASLFKKLVHLISQKMWYTWYPRKGDPSSNNLKINIEIKKNREGSELMSIPVQLLNLWLHLLCTSTYIYVCTFCYYHIRRPTYTDQT